MIETTVYRKRVMEKGIHELFNHFLDGCFLFKADVWFKTVLSFTVCCSSLSFCYQSSLITLCETDNEQLNCGFEVKKFE